MKKLLPVLLIILVLGVGYYFYSNSKSDKIMTPSELADSRELETTDEESLKGKLADLLKLNASMQCTFDYESEGITNSGKVYVTADGKKMKGDFKIVDAAGVETTSGMISDGEYSYIWSSDMEQGLKTKLVEDETSMETEDLDFEYGGNEGVFNDEEVNYSCSPWIANDAMFTPPTDIEFMDLAEFNFDY